MSEVGGKVYPVHNNVFKFGTKGYGQRGRRYGNACGSGELCANH